MADTCRHLAPFSARCHFPYLSQVQEGAGCGQHESASCCPHPACPTSSVPPTHPCSRCTPHLPLLPLRPPPSPPPSPRTPPPAPAPPAPPLLPLPLHPAPPAPSPRTPSPAPAPPAPPHLPLLPCAPTACPCYPCSHRSASGEGGLGSGQTHLDPVSRSHNFTSSPAARGGTLRDTPARVPSGLPNPALRGACS